MRLGRAGLLAILVAASACAPNDPEVMRVEAARLWLGDRPTPPAPDDLQWRAVALPDVWTFERRRRVLDGWYRTEIAVGARPSDVWSIYFPWISRNAGIYVNGTLIGRGAAIDDPMAVVVGRPMAFPIPGALLPGPTAVIDVRYRVSATSPAVMMPFFVGPDALVQPAFRWRFFLRVTLGQSIAAATLLIALVLIAAYWPRDPTGEYRWTAVALIALAIGTGQGAMEIPLPPKFREAVWVIAINGFIVAMVMGLHRVLRESSPRVEAAFWGSFVLGTVAVLVVPDLYVFHVANTWGIATAVGGVYLLWLLRRARRRGRIRHPYTAWFAAILAASAGLHDAAVLVMKAPLLDVFLLPYMGVGIMVAGAWGLLTNLLQALRETDELNRTLEERVDEKGRELERNYARVRDLERDRAIAGERERIMRDMHDGMGGQLVSTLALVESGHAAPTAIAEALRDALDDLRLVIDSLDPGEGDIATLLGLIRGRLEPRLGRHGLAFAWAIEELPPLDDLGPARALHVMRIVQEAITNVVKHANARTITVRTGTETRAAPGVFVEVADDGVGIGEAPAAGRGLTNMQRRALALGGAVEVMRGAQGTRVRLWLPLTA